MEVLNIVVIGCGNISQTHFDSIRKIKGARLYAVIDSCEEKAREISSREGCLFFKDVKGIVDDLKVHAVHITTPHSHHVGLALDLARAGKHILIEKPLAETYESAKLLSNSLEELEVVSGIVYQNRFNPSVLMLKKIIDEKSYGKLLGLKGILSWNRDMSYYYSSDWRGIKKLEGGGVLINQGIHTLDILQWLGGEVTESKGSISRHKLNDDIEIEDTAEIFMKFGNGARGIFYATNNYSYNSSIEVEAHCEEGVLNIKNGRLVLYQDSNEEVLCRDLPNTSEKFYYGNYHTDLIEGFYRAVRGDSSALIPVSEGLGALKIIDSLY